MKIERVVALYFSPAGATGKTACTIAEELAVKLGVPCQEISFTRPGEREKEVAFTEKDLVVAASPTYAGKLPNKLLPEFREKWQGNGALAVAVVTFGNRSYDNALAELGAVLEGNGFHTVAGGAFVTRHAFTDELAYGRPGWSDTFEMKNFADSIADKVDSLTDVPAPVQLPGDADAPYYTPKGTDGQPAKFLKAKPKTDTSRCSRCGACVRMCPMGAINPADPADVPGTCIKCHACVRKCTKQAKSFDDPAFLSHRAMLEQTFAEPKENELYL